MQAAAAAYTPTSYIKGIDGIRAIAVLSVMLFHAAPNLLPGGFSGVDVFFVISGYVVTGSLIKHTHLSFNDFITGFYARRLTRILPALVVCLVLSVLVTTLFVPKSWLSSVNSKTALNAFWGLSNFALLSNSDGYFSPRIEFNPFAHTWSLAVEEQFYLIFPFVLFIWLRFKNHSKLIGSAAQLILPLLLISSLVYARHESLYHPDNAYYLLPSRFWELAVGAGLFILHQQQRFIPRNALAINSNLLLGVGLVGLGFFVADKNAFPYPWALFAVAGTAMMICGLVNSANHRGLIQKTLESTAMTYVGKISYSLYLWHWPVYVIQRWTFGFDSIAEKIFAIALTFLLANLSYFYIEKPTRQLNVLRTLPSGAIVKRVLLGVFIACLLAVATYKSQSTISLSQTKNKSDWYPKSWPQPTQNNTPKVFEGQTLFALGDSHTEAYSTLLQQVRDQLGATVHKFGQGGCGAANFIGTTNESCKQRQESALQQIEATAKPNDILLLASLRTHRFSDQWAVFDVDEILAIKQSDDDKKTRINAFNEAEGLIKRLAPLQLQIIIEAPKPVFISPPFRCSDWFNQGNPDCRFGNTMDKDLLLNHRQYTMQAIEHLAREYSNITIWDPFPVLCPNNPCKVFDGEKSMYFDADHLSAHGNRVLFPDFTRVLTTLWHTKTPE